MESKEYDLDSLVDQIGKLKVTDDEDRKAETAPRKKKSGPFTHMVGIPIHDDVLMANIKSFQEECTKMNKDIKNHPEWLKKLGRFHFTIMLLICNSEDEIDNAKDVLKSIKPRIMKILNNKKYEIELKNLNYFPERPYTTSENTRVLWTEMVAQKSKDKSASNLSIFQGNEDCLNQSYTTT